MAWWLNVGVQIFLCLSGYLYGKKDIVDDLAFYKKQFAKILIPYYLVIVLAIIAQFIFARDEVSIVLIAKAMLVNGTLKGGEHLWFVPTILFCYILTPLINRINNCIFEKKRPLVYILLVFAMISLLVRLFVNYFNPAWIACFYIGHVLGKNEIRTKMHPLICKGVIYAVAICLVSIQILVSYVLKIEITGYIKSMYDIICDYGHTFLGVAIVLLLLAIFRHIRMCEVVLKPISFLDSVSYEGYLVHQFFIFGAFSFLRIIDLPIVAVAAIFAITFALGSVIKLVSRKIKYILSKSINC